MKICINGLYFTHGIMGGVETYLQGLLSHLPGVCHDVDFVLLLGDRYAGGLDIPDPMMVSKIKTFADFDPRRRVNLFLNVAVNADIHSSQLNRIKADVIHYPFTLLLPPVSNLPTVLTFHDMQHEFYPAFFSSKERLFRSRTYKTSAERATRLIAISNHVKQCLMEVYGISPNKIDVVYNGYSADCRVIDNSDALLEVRKRYGLDRPFMYYPAATWRHKNHVRLLEALRLLVARNKFDGQLILTGVAKEQNGEVHRKITELGLENHVRVLGYLPYGDLPFIYNIARLLVFPSLFEGFGIPLVEAMACGCPVVAADCTSIPEVLADAGKFFDPTSVEDMAEKIWSVWNDDAEIIAMRQKGLSRSSMFTWENTAKETLNVYYKTVM